MKLEWSSEGLWVGMGMGWFFTWEGRRSDSWWVCPTSAHTLRIQIGVSIITPIIPCIKRAEKPSREPVRFGKLRIARKLALYWAPQSTDQRPSSWTPPAPPPLSFGWRTSLSHPAVPILAGSEGSFQMFSLSLSLCLIFPPENKKYIIIYMIMKSLFWISDARDINITQKRKKKRKEKRGFHAIDKFPWNDRKMSIGFPGPERSIMPQILRRRRSTQPHLTCQSRGHSFSFS